MTKTEIINETVAYYSADPKGTRSIYYWSTGSNMCVYLNRDNGHKCAVGRCLKDPGKIAASASITSLVNDGYVIDSDFTEPYQGHNVTFWSALQALHDRDFYWNAAGLTELGISYVQQLLTKYQNQ